MSAVQSLLATWLAQLTVILPLGYAFGAGMVAAINPCGFMMLPAYFSLYVGVAEGPAAPPVAQRLLRGILVGVSVSARFVVLFAAVGLVVSTGGYALVRTMPWIGLLVGVVMVLLGLALLVGRGFSLALLAQWADRIGRPGAASVRGFFLFGVAYGLASLGCTLPIFLVAVGSALARQGLVASLWQFASYAAGMATVVVSLTITLALCKAGLVRVLRGIVPYVQQLAAALLVLAGGWIALYYWAALHPAPLHS